MIELVAVMLVLGVLAAIAIPRLVDGYGNAPQVYRDQVLSGLRMAQKSATARRRVVCVNAGERAMVLSLASAPGVPAACDSALAGIGADDYRSPRDGVTSGGLAGGGRMLYFLPDGSISTDGAGQQLAIGQVTILAGGQEQFHVSVDGRTGHVE